MGFMSEPNGADHIDISAQVCGNRIEIASHQMPWTRQHEAIQTLGVLE